MHRSLQTAVAWYFILFTIYKGVHKGEARAYLMGGGGGFNLPPPPKFSDFFLKSERKEVERKRKKWEEMWGGRVNC